MIVRLETALPLLGREIDLDARVLLQGAWALALGRFTGEDEVAFDFLDESLGPGFPESDQPVPVVPLLRPLVVRLTPDRELRSWFAALASGSPEVVGIAERRSPSESATADRGDAFLQRTLLVVENGTAATVADRLAGRTEEQATSVLANGYSLVLTGTISGPLLSLRLSAADDSVDPDLSRRLGEHLRLILDALPTCRHQAIRVLPPLTAAEERLLSEWNATDAAYEREATIPQLFEDQAGRTPDAVALRWDGRDLTYRQLNEQANQLARYLQSLGVAPGVLVGVCLERSFDLVVGLLGILKAGGAYVPLDPNYPRERLRFILDDSAARVVLTAERLLAGVPETSARVVCLDRDPAIQRQPKDNLPDSPAPADVAYVIYTSGSSGAPKGVLGLHRGALNRFSWMWRTYPFGPFEVGCQKTTLSFVDSVWEIFGPLLAGTASVLIPDDAVRDPERLIDTLATNRVSRIVLVPSLLRALLDRGTDLATRLPQLKLWVTSGEALPVDLGRAFRAVFPDRVLLNLYGSTEVSADATYYEVGREIPDNTIPIGRPMANVRVAVLDQRRQPVPLGVAGELYVGGDGVARGYLNRPELTAARFIADPTGQAPGVRFYQTGDVARFRSDGNLEYLGRIDQQVKIRGYRIELGEVEAALAQHPAVHQAIVVAREDRPGDKRLVAYVVAQGDAPLDGREVRRFLGERLPGFMVPALVVVLDALPLLPNGKVDRLGLPPPEAVRPGGVAFRRPATEREQAIAGVWEEVLGVSSIGVDEDFFALGGDSLAAARVAARLAQVLHVEIPLRDLFECPTVGALAREIERRAGAGESRRFAITPRPSDGSPLPVSYGQESVWFLHQVNPSGAIHNLPIALRLEGELDEAALRRALDLIVARHEVLRTTFASVDGQPVLAVSPARGIDLKIVDARTWPEPERANELFRQLMVEAGQPFDLTRDVMLRATLFRLGPAENVLLLVSHHVASDGWSTGVLLAELAALYRDYRAGNPPGLPALPFQYVDYARWQRAQVGDPANGSDYAYWRERLAGRQPVWYLPTDHPREPLMRPDVLLLTSARQLLVIAPDLEDAIGRLGREAKVTPFMILLAAVAALLWQKGSQTDIVVGAPVARRYPAETEALIGFISNTLPLRVDLSGDPTIAELLQRVRASMVGGVEHQDLPFSAIVEAAGIRRDPRNPPLFSVMLNLEKLPPAPLNFPGLNATLFDVSTGVIALNLDIQFVDGPEGLRGWFDYPTELFAATTVQRMVEHLKRLLAAMADNPERRLSALPAIDGGDRSHATGTVAAPVRGPAHSPTYRPPREGLERQIAAIWEDLLGIRRIGARDNFFDLGGDSLLALQVLARIEREIGTKLPVATFFWAPTIEEMAEALRQPGWRPPWSSLVPIHADGSLPPFFCVHGFGGGVLGYADLARALGPDQPVYGLQALGRDAWDVPQASIEAMAAHYISEIRAVQPTGPYYLGGYCAGATIAFEMAQEFHRDGSEVALLAVIEGEAPGPAYRNIALRPTWFLRFVANLPFWVRDFLLLSRPERRGRSRRRLGPLLGRFFGQRSTSGALANSVPLQNLVDNPAGVPADLVSLLITHGEAFAAYVPCPYPGLVSLFRTRRHPLFCSFDPTKGWASLSPHRVDVVIIPGAHQNVLQPPHVGTLAARLRAALTAARLLTTPPDRSTSLSHALSPRVI